MNVTAIKKIEKELLAKRCLVDGVINLKEYQNSKYKIAWFLKEGYSLDGEVWCYRDLLKKSYDEFFKTSVRPTWHPIIYTTYSILNGFRPYNDLPYIKDKPEMCKIVSSIALINANKEPSPSGKNTNYSKLSGNFKKWQWVIKRQYEALDPDIWIFGNTGSLYKETLELESVPPKSSNNMIDVWTRDGKIYIDAYHPACKKSKGEYVNTIIAAVKEWSESRSDQHSQLH